MVSKVFVSKILTSLSIFAVTSLLLAVAPPSRGWAMLEPDDTETFVSKARLYAAIYGTKTVTKADNEGRNKFTYIPDDTGSPFAVIKEGKRAAKEAFISSYTRSLRLDNVAISIHVANFTIKDQSQPFEGLLEEYLSLRTPHALLEEDLERFIKKYKKNNSIILQSITKNPFPEDMTTLFKHLDVDSVHKIFSYVILVNGTDSDPKNIALRLNKENKLEMQIFDTELAFSNKIERSIIYYLPFVDVPLSEKIRDIILSWTLEEGSKTDKYVPDAYVYADQQNRIQDFQNYLRTHPQATPMDIMLFAFFKTPKAEWSDGHINTQGTDYIQRINLWEATHLNPKKVPKKVEDFGSFFNGGLKMLCTGYIQAVYDYNILKEGQERTLADFIAFIPSQDYFIPEKLSEYKSVVEEKFGLQL